MKTLINVTQEHIDTGKKGKCQECPIALAVQEKCSSEISVAVISDGIFLNNETNFDDEIALSVPSEVSQFVWNFDLNGEVKPFSFELDIPAELLAEAK